MPRQVLLTKEINVDELEIQAELNKAQASGIRTSFVNYPKGTTNNLIFQTPSLRLPFDLDYSQSKVAVDLECPPSTFLNKMKSLDTTIKGIAKTNSQAWFNRATLTDEMVQHKYTPIIKQDAKGEYMPKFRFKVNANTEYFDHQNRPLKITDVTKNCKLTAIVELKYMWTKQADFGVTFVAKKVKVDSTGGTQEIEFVDDDDSY